MADSINAGDSYLIFGGNFTGGTAFLGTNAGESLNGTVAAENLVGGGGNDTLNGGLGNDVLLGAAGNDVFIFDSADILRVDGGNGVDTLRLQSGAAFNPSATSPVDNIEFIDAQTDTGANALTLDLLDVLNLSDSTNDLFISGSEDATDTLDQTGFMDSLTNMMVGGEAYSIYIAAGTDAQLFVDDDIVVT